MATLRLQASDFQDAGIEGNLAKFKQVKEHANSLHSQNPNVTVDLVGNLFDAHVLGDESQGQILMQLAGSTEQGKAFMDKYVPYVNGLVQKHGQGFHDKLNAEEKEKMAQFENMLINYSMLGYYAQINHLLSDCKPTILAVHGNNDSNMASKVVTKAKFIDLEHKVLDDKGLKVVGGNNTNYEPEMIFGEMGVKCDGDYDWSSVKERPDVLLLHGPPNGANLRDGHDTSKNKLDAMIQSKKPQLVECGHFHKGLLRTVGGVTYARSSPNVYFVHKFDDKKKYVETEIYKYAA